MNTERLAAWIKAEIEKASSARQLSISLGTSGPTVTALRDQKRQAISPELVKAIALRRKESVVETSAWLEIEPPVGFDIPQKLLDIQKQIDALSRKTEYAYQRAIAQDEIASSAVLETYLLEHGINVRRRSDQERMRSHVAELSDTPALFERLLLGITGILPIEPNDLPVCADLLKIMTGQPWTPAEVVRVIEQAQAR